MRFHGHAHAVKAPDVENKPRKKRDSWDISRPASPHVGFEICNWRHCSRKAHSRRTTSKRGAPIVAELRKTQRERALAKAQETAADAQAVLAALQAQAT